MAKKRNVTEIFGVHEDGDGNCSVALYSSYDAAEREAKEWMYILHYELDEQSKEFIANYVSSYDKRTKTWKRGKW